MVYTVAMAMGRCHGAWRRYVVDNEITVDCLMVNRRSVWQVTIHSRRR